MRAEAVVEQRRALQRFAGADDAARELLLHIVAAGNRPGRAGSGSHATVAVPRPHDAL